MNQLLKWSVCIVIICSVACNNRKDNSRVEDANVSTKYESTFEIAKNNQEKEIEVFFVRAKKAAQSNDDSELRSIIKFPLFGYGDNFKLEFKTYEDLKRDGKVYAIFKEYIAIATEIELDNSILKENGENSKWYSIKYLVDFYSYFKIDKVEGELKIVGVYIPGA